MAKRKSLIKTLVKTGATGRRVVINARRREIINPGPSPEAIEKIERYEESSLRAEQRLGMTRLA